MDEKKLFFQVKITDEQIDYTNKLVDYSIKYHKVADIFESDPHAKGRQREYRFTGTLGEVVFADAYSLYRPTRSFGAVDGQDYGRDFLLNFCNNNFCIDLKTMNRKKDVFKENYVFNLPSYQVNREDIVTDCYYFLTISKNYNKNLVASFIGYAFRNDIKCQTIGKLYKKGEKRIKDNNDFFVFHEDTYEVEFKEIISPLINDNIRKTDGFCIKEILKK